MILTCPNCSTRYQTDAGNFPPEGRKVRCAQCGFVWHHVPETNEADDDEISFSDIPDVPPETQAEPPETEASGNESEPSPSESLSAHHFGSDRPRAEDAAPPTIWEKLLVGVGWAGLVAVLLLIAWAAVSYRQIVMASWPPSTSVYAKLGYIPDAGAIRLTADPYRKVVENGEPVLLISGKLINGSTHDITVPALRASLSDASGRELYHWTFRPADASLPSGQSTRFVTRLSSPPAEARHLELRFAKAGE